MRINVKIVPNGKVSSVSFTPEDFDLTNEEWEALSKSEQEEYIQNAVNSLPDTPYWVVDNFETD